MCKRKLIPVFMRNRSYRICVEDLKNVFRRKKKPRPRVPEYHSLKEDDEDKTEISSPGLKRYPQ
jgi:hypothetical protein